MLAKITTQKTSITFTAHSNAYTLKPIGFSRRVLGNQIDKLSLQSTPAKGIKQKITLKYLQLEMLRLLNKLPINVTKFDTPEIKQIRGEALDYAHSLPPTIAQSSPQRKAMREQIIRKLFLAQSDVRQERTLYLTLGAPGSGKSTLSETIAKDKKALHIDIDAICFEIPEFKANPKRMFVVAEEAFSIRNKMIDIAMQNGSNIIIDDTTSNQKRLFQLLKKIKAHNYNVNIILVDLPANKAFERTIARYRKTGRFTDPIYYKYFVENPLKTYRKLISKYKEYVDSYTHYSSDVPPGQPFKLISSSDECS